jgi:hypothetical protein
MGEEGRMKEGGKDGSKQGKKIGRKLMTGLTGSPPRALSHISASGYEMELCPMCLTCAPIVIVSITSSEEEKETTSERERRGRGMGKGKERRGKYLRQWTHAVGGSAVPSPHKIPHHDHDRCVPVG